MYNNVYLVYAGTSFVGGQSVSKHANEIYQERDPLNRDWIFIASIQIQDFTQEYQILVKQNH